MHINAREAVAYHSNNIILQGYCYGRIETFCGINCKYIMFENGSILYTVCDFASLFRNKTVWNYVFINCIKHSLSNCITVNINAFNSCQSNNLMGDLTMQHEMLFCIALIILEPNISSPL